MGTLSNPEISSDLQGFYLANKQWFSDVLFLEDEMRFFLKVFYRLFPSAVRDDKFKGVQRISILLQKLEERRNHLKTRLINHQEILEFMLGVNKEEIGLDTLNENAFLINEIKELFISDRLIKKELFTMVEELIQEEKASHLLGSDRHPSLRDT